MQFGRGLGALRATLLTGAFVLGAVLPLQGARAAGSCAPTANGVNAGGRTAASGTQLCQGGDTGIWYKATGGNLTVNLNNEPITTNGININDDGLARNLTLNAGLAGSYTGAAIKDSTAGGGGNFAGIALTSSGGNVAISTATGSIVTVTGGPGFGIGGVTGGAGTVSISTGDTVTDLTGTGVGAQTANGAATITADADVTAGQDALYAAATGTGNVTVTAGAAGSPVTIATTAPDIHDAVNASSQGGNVAVTTYGTATGELLGSTNGAGTVTITANGTVSTTGGNAAIFAHTANGAATVTTNGNLTGDIAATAAGTGNIAVTTNGNISETDTFASIFATSSGGNVAITANGILQNGVDAETSGNGTVTVTTNGNIPNTQAFDSVFAQGQNGNVSVTASSGTISATTGSYGIDAVTTGSGIVAVSLGSGLTIDPPTVGVFAHSNAGLASVATAGNVTITAADTDSAGGITARSDLAPATPMLTASVITGTNNSIAVTGDDSAGITAVNEGNGTGGVSISTGNGNTITVTGNTDAGLLADTTNTLGFSPGGFDGSGDIAINVGANNTIRVNAGSDAGGAAPANGGVVAATDGGSVAIAWTGNGGSVTVSGKSGYETAGVLAFAGDGSGTLPTTLTITTGSGTAITSTNGIGIFAVNSGTGQTAVASNGPITTAATGGLITLSDFTGGTLPAGAVSSNVFGGGIVAFGLGNVSVASTGTISVAGGDGIDAFALGSTQVTSSAAISASNGDGIFALGIGNVAINAQSAVSSNQTAILGFSTQTLSIVNSGMVTGAGTGAYPVIGIFAPGMMSITNQAGGTIRSNAGLASDLVVTEPAYLTTFALSQGPVAIANAGTITGRVDLSHSAGAAISNAGSWSTSGTNNFAAANSVLTNAAGGHIATAGTTTFAFASAGNSVANAGTLAVAGTATFTGQQSFTNTGLLDLHGADNAAGDALAINGVLTAGNGSKLAVDAALGTTASGAACGAVADCLQLGGSSGLTSIIVHDSASAGTAGLNTGGILLVNGATSAANFVLDPSSPGYDARTGGIDAGLFSYTLGFANGQERLYGGPDKAMFQLPELASGAENIWYETSPWLDRQADLRDQLGADGTGHVTPGVWTKAVGNWVDRDAVSVLSGPGVTTTSLSTPYRQETYAVVAGADTGAQGVLAGSDTLLVGVMAGFLDSNLDFSGTSSGAGYSGALVGAYTTWLNDGFVADAAIKANFLNATYSDSGTSGFRVKPSATQVGAQLDLGKRFAFSPTAFLEPLGSVSYLSTSIDHVTVGTANVDFGTNTSARGSLGLRAGTTALSSNGANVDLSLTGRIWDAFDSDNKAVITSAGTPLTVTDRFGGVFGEVQGNVALSSADSAWSGFASAGVKFKSGFTSETLTLGIRYRW
jgi:hypothetical protein